MTRPSAGVSWGGSREDDGPPCLPRLARVVLVVAVLLARWSR